MYICSYLFLNLFEFKNSGFWLFPWGPGGFREVREAGRKHFHLSWYLSVAVVTSYDLIRKLINSSYFFLGYVYPKKLGLDSISTSWDLKFRIPRRKLRIQSYSQVCRSKPRSKYLNVIFLTKNTY